jgi:hypothetical protein
MAWIELHQSVRDHRKIIEFASLLEMPEPHVVGHLAYLWLWALDNAPDGVLPLSKPVIERAAQWQGKPGVFVDALLDCHLLDMASADRWEIHDWDHYAGKLMDRRAANRERQARHRDKKREEQTDNGDVTVTSPSGNGATVPYPTKPNHKGDKSPYSLEFESFWKLTNKKGSKQYAQVAWNKLSASDRAKAMELVPAWTAIYPQIDFEYHVVNWLKQRIWESELPKPRAQNGKYIHQRDNLPDQNAEMGWSSPDSPWKGKVIRVGPKQ